MKKNNRNIFDNLEVAFKHKTDGDLRFSAFIFGLMNNPFLVKFSTKAALWSVKLGLPIDGIIKATIFRQFCGGQTREQSIEIVNKLGNFNVKSILDYSVEGENKEAHFENTANEIVRVIELAKNNENIPVSCVKLTGIGNFDLYEKISSGKQLSSEENEALERVKKRLNKLCEAAKTNNVPIYIDAEESWIQEAIDNLAHQMIIKFNTKKAVVFNTIQMYRWDRLDFFKKAIETAKNNGVKYGVKIVRGAYIEQENARAKKLGYKTPIQPSKEATDNDYNEALRLSLENIDVVEICAGTHNEESSILLTELIKEKDLDKNHPHIYFSQLYGMSDHISFNLAKLGYNVSKYVPYGPIKSTLPYLIRRAEENTSIAGQVSNELLMIKKEQERRKKLRN